MRRILFALAVLLVAACHPHPAGPVALQTGDLLFTGLPMGYLPGAEHNPPVDSITCAGDSLNLIHVSILEVEGDSTWVIDATLKRGVARYPLADFLTDFTLSEGGLPWFIVARLSSSAASTASASADNAGCSATFTVSSGNSAGSTSASFSSAPADAPDALERYVARARELCGQPYDVAFKPDNGALYCSELVRESYVTAAGDTLFPEAAIDWRNAAGEVAPYWTWLFNLIGADLPSGSGTLPASLLASPQLQILASGPGVIWRP